jgi:predicted  nucleic acid-binding Zn-ribbon protein
LPPDRTRDLQAAQEKAEVQTKEVEKLEEEIATLEKTKRILEKEVEDYKKKYPVVR